ncbi:MAG: TonB-dependent receptor, partial [Luteimonas sp.]|nr:TonB-dependent receptor [Luteimonas sp.]
MRSNQTLTRALLAHAVAVALLSSGSAIAQSSSPAPQATSARAGLIDVNIPEQPIVSALERFAEQSGLQVVYSTQAPLRDQLSPRVAGRFPPDRALTRILSNSNLTFVFVNDTTVTIEAKENAGAATGAAVAAPAAAAAMQDAAGTPVAADSAAEPTTMAAMIVTGTNLRGIDPASPLMVIDAELIEARGYTSLEDVLRHLPQNFSSKTTAGAALGETEFGDTYSPFSSLGASSVNLRGLGSRSTLILVDGRRRAGSAQSQGGYTDISSIPLSQVERIEVLSDGASAIYGSDAVAGVVNIVLKKDYAGGVIQMRHEDSSSGGDGSRIDASRSFGWGNGSLSATASVQRKKPANLLRFIRTGPDGVGDFTADGGVNSRTRNFGQPGVVYQSLDFGIGYHFLGDILGVI